MTVRAFTDRLKREHDEQITYAWVNAYFQRVEKMPKLEEFLQNKPEKKKKQTSAEAMLEIVKGLNAAFGGEVS